MKILSYLAKCLARDTLCVRGYSSVSLRQDATALSLSVVAPFAEMLLHVATITVFVNIAIIELDSFYSLPEKDSDSLLDESPLHRVFVYGTLKRGEPNHGLIKDTTNGYAKFLGIGKTTVRYPLVIATKYNIPFLLKKPDFGNYVFGEIYDVDSDMLKRLDQLEEHPQFYERTEEKVLLAPEAALKPGKTFEEVGESTSAWIYFLPRFRSSLLASAMYASYTNGSHGLKYCENDEDASSLDDVL
ncbi:PREDICTED: putative gamma-glutamylcyclotransferase CG2811 isoform X2 [Wasmannia auropunctata]|uniref:putative gamma-glutamylcyclotransferase CG2811 isoform X2 n=1 Tax=Wasmannia auropunctata TaxID=64793 RepID=UPI0005F08668|nr:PREDICTED: putative gamma-glutamylcyclotransferase CG2811 isoform X2 [Wasmannia auropunctata]